MNTHTHKNIIERNGVGEKESNEKRKIKKKTNKKIWRAHHHLAVWSDVRKKKRKRTYSRPTIMSLDSYYKATSFLFLLLYSLFFFALFWLFWIFLFFCLGRRPSSFIFAWFLLVCSCFVKTGKRNPRLMSRLERKGQCGARAQFKLSFCCSLNRPKTKSNNNNSNHFFFREWYNEAAIYRLGSTGHADVTLGASFFLICFDSRSCHVTLIQSARNQQVSGRIFFYEILSEGGGILRKMIYSHSNNRTCVYCLDNKTRRSPGEVDSCFVFFHASI